MASILIGFHKCPFCGGKTHVKVKVEEGKKAYSHCLDEFDQGCSHTGHATTAKQDQLLRAAMRPAPGVSPTPTGTSAPEAKGAEPTPTPTPSGSEPTQASGTPTPTPTATAKRRGLFA